MLGWGGSSVFFFGLSGPLDRVLGQGQHIGKEIQPYLKKAVLPIESHS